MDAVKEIPVAVKEIKTITTLNRQRGALKTKSTRLKTFVETFQPSEIESENRIQLQAKQVLLNELKRGINELYREYFDLPDNIETAQPLAALEDIEVESEQTQVSLSLFLSRYEIKESSAPINPGVIPETKSNVKYRLPEIPLMSFSGNLMDFQSFKNQFLSIIGQNDQLTDIQKLYYLKASLKGSVKLLETSHDTFDSLWSSLQSRFEDKRAILDAYINSILCYPKISETSAQISLLVDTIRSNLRALKLINYERNELANALILNSLLTKVGQDTRTEYEKTITANTLPALDQFLRFLEERIKILDAIAKTSNPSNKYSNAKQTFKPFSTANNNPNPRPKNLFASQSTIQKRYCACGESIEKHALYRCTKFQNLNVRERINLVNKLQICKICLRSHDNLNCMSRGACKFCGFRNHNTYLCLKNSNQNSMSRTETNFPAQHSASNSTGNSKHLSPLGAQTSPVNSENNQTLICNAGTNVIASSFQEIKPHCGSLSEQGSGIKNKGEGSFEDISIKADGKSLCSGDAVKGVAFLADGKGRSKNYTFINTAKIYLYNIYNKPMPFTAILDSGSSNHYLSSYAANLLSLLKQKIFMPISGLGSDISLTAKAQVSTRLTNEAEDVNFDVDMYVIPKITEIIHPCYFDAKSLKIPENIKLANEQFNENKKIDVLLSAGLFFQFLREGRIFLEDNVVLQNSCFGFLISGSIKLPIAPSLPQQSSTSNHCFLAKNMENLDQTLRAFWEIERLSDDHITPSNELQYCDAHFDDTHLRKNDGRFQVQLPFRPDIDENSILGNSRNLAEKRLNQTWKRLERDDKLKNLYMQFLEEYKQMGHMKEIPTNPNDTDGYYFAHHAILKDSSTTSKIRVVFNGSAKTTSGVSLNDILLKGGAIQPELFDILLRFRQHPYALSGDIKMMFRQIEVHPSQVKFQKILWKDSVDGPIQTFALQTVCYGTTSASYLATKTLQKIAIEAKQNYPAASEVILNHFYMDDCLCGTSSVPELIQLKSDLTHVFANAGMVLHKWCSNTKLTDDNTHSFPFENNTDNFDASVSRTLGLIWNASDDTFHFKVAINNSETVTKHSILSQIARVFDPLGLISPTITLAKIQLQQLWKLKVNWHEPLPKEICYSWNKFLQKLPAIEQLKIPRFVLQKDASVISLEGFADSSEKAYGAVVYVRTSPDNKNFSYQLLCSKSRVAPIKTLTMPRLELQACLLLAKLVHRVTKSLHIAFSEIKLYTDSTIALCWIRTEPYLLKSFVSNRVSQIQLLSDIDQWSHVPSLANPADCLSRGVDAQSLLMHPLWWSGPPVFSSKFVPSSASLEIADQHIVQMELKPPSKGYSKSNSLLTSCNQGNSPPEGLNPGGILLPVVKPNNLYEIYFQFNNFAKSTQISNFSENKSLITSDTQSFFDNFLKLSNNITKLTHVLSFVNRFLHNSRYPNDKWCGPLSASETERGLVLLIKNAQVTGFKREIDAVTQGKPVHSSSKLKFLHVFLDHDKLIRVGGRLALQK